MHNPLRLIAVAGLAALIVACSFATPSSQSGGVSTLVASTLQALTAHPPTVPGVPVSYTNVSFVIPPGVATGASPQTIAAADEKGGGPWWEAAPQHTEFALIGYGLPQGFFSTVLIDIYPAEEFARANSVADLNLKRLKAVLSNPTAPRTNDNLPQVPFFNAAPMFAAQVKVVQFKDGSGARMITQYGQAPGPAANNGTFYHFEGLTQDGKYLVIAVLPIQAPFLENGNDPSAPTPAGAIPFPGYNYTDPAYYGNYYKAVTDRLDATPADTFRPALSALDALIQSLAIAP